MWVTDERVEEYKAAGHSLAADSSDVAKDPWKKTEVKKETTTKCNTGIKK